LANKLIFHILLANILWSFVPILAYPLFNEVSILSIIFLRFFISGIVLLIIALILIVYNNRFTKNEKISLKLILHFLKHKNKRFFRARNISYFTAIGFFGIILQLIFFFLTIKLTSITFTIIGFLLSIVIIAIYEKSTFSEKFDVFKVIYIIILVFTSILILEVAITGSLIIGSPISLNATIYMILFSVSISFLYIAINKDTLSKIEAELINKNKLYKVPRSLLKISISFLTGIFLMFIFLTIILILPFETDITQEALLFFSELQNISSILLRWEIQLLVIFSTIIPYILVYFANANWRSTSLTYSQWNSILNLIDPMGSLILAVLLVNEYFPIEILIITIFLLVIAIIIRHAHETKNLVQAILLINLEKGAMENIPVKLLKYNGIFQVNSITGTHDLILNVKTNNIREFYYLINNRLRTLSEIINIKILFINKIIELQP